jgi:hypothetical protein
MQTCTSSEKPPNDKFRVIDLSVVLSPPPPQEKNQPHQCNELSWQLRVLHIIADPPPPSPVGRSETTDIDAGSVNRSLLR